MKRSAASVTVKLRGGPFDGQSAVAYGAILGSLIEVNHRSYRVTKIEQVPGRREETGTAIFEPRPDSKHVAQDEAKVAATAAAKVAAKAAKVSPKPTL
jgi:hypothetical protein